MKVEEMNVDDIPANAMPGYPVSVTQSLALRFSVISCCFGPMNNPLLHLSGVIYFTGTYHY